MLEIPCHCGNKITSDFKTEIELSASPEIYREIVEGSFMTFNCPKCGNDIRTETEVRLHDADKGLDIFFIPEIERLKFMSGSLKTTAGRVVIGYPELVEKIVLIGEGLDDRIIEIIKFRLLEKAETKNIRIYFSSKEGDNLLFYIHGLKPDQLGVSRIPFSLYSRIENELENLLEDNDIKLFTDGQYVSVNRISLED